MSFFSPFLLKLLDHFQALHPIIFGGAYIHAGIVRWVSQSVNLSLGPRWTGSHATPSQTKTSSTSATGLMLGMIMPPSPLISVFLFLSSLTLPWLSICPSLPLSIYLLSSGGCWGIGQRHCVGGDYVWSADSDLTFSMLSLRLKPTLVDSPPPRAQALCSCYFFFAVALMFHTYFAERGDFRPRACSNCPVPVAFHGRFVVLFCVHLYARVHNFQQPRIIITGAAVWRGPIKWLNDLKL